jgi:hypothetical protein
MVVWMSLLVTLFQAQVMLPRLEKTMPPLHPPNTVGSAWVIADLGLGPDGAVHSVSVFEGADPFKANVLAAVSRWKFTPVRNNEPLASRVAAVFLFRPPDFFSAQPRERVLVARQDRAALPLTLTDPGYPLQSVGFGATMLELQISNGGAVESVRVVVDESGLAASTAKHVQAWKFQSAMRGGVETPGTVIVVISYMRPLLAPASPPLLPPPPPPRPVPGGVFRGD